MAWKTYIMKALGIGTIPFSGYELTVNGQALIGKNTRPSAPNGRGDDLVVVPGTAPHAGITILASTSVGDATIFFGDDSSAIRGRVQYVNEDEALNLGAGGSLRTLGITISLVEIPEADLKVAVGSFTLGGDLLFDTAGGGLSYGECHGHDIDWGQDSLVQDQWYPISDASMVSGALHNVTHDGNGQLTLAAAGVYLVSYKIVAESNSANEHIHTGIEINGSGTPPDNSIDHNETKFANQETPFGRSCYLTVTAGQTLNAMISTANAGTPDLIVDDVNIVATKIGG